MHDMVKEELHDERVEKTLVTINFHLPIIISSCIAVLFTDLVQPVIMTDWAHIFFLL